MSLALEEIVRVPAWVVDNDSFVRWAASADFPQRGRFSFLNNEVWIDMSPEELFTHNQVKGEYATVLTVLLKKMRTGRFYHDRTLLTNRKARLSTEPDGLYVSFQSIRDGRIRKVRSKRGYIAWRGTPDMALEVVSDSSEKKDAETLRTLYWKAGIQEYWLVDARSRSLQFTILCRSRKGYMPVSKENGWQKSEVFGKSFKLSMDRDELGDPEYTLAVR
jgi:Uma2 family endonuclease